jgi:hypothetical protein
MLSVMNTNKKTDKLNKNQNNFKIGLVFKRRRIKIEFTKEGTTSNMQKSKVPVLPYT